MRGQILLQGLQEDRRDHPGAPSEIYLPLRRLQRQEHRDRDGRIPPGFLCQRLKSFRIICFL